MPDSPPSRISVLINKVDVQGYKYTSRCLKGKIPLAIRKQEKHSRYGKNTCGKSTPAKGGGDLESRRVGAFPVWLSLGGIGIIRKEYSEPMGLPGA